MANIKKLTKQEKRFCVCFLSTGNAALSARKAGYVGDIELIGEGLICREEIAKELGRLAKQREKSLENVATAGYQRLAFGSIGDAVSLLYKTEPSDDELGKMDLFLVSEIKKPKDGSMEIKFFDRLKALEKLSVKKEVHSGAKQLFDAINRSAEAVDMLGGN